MPVAAADTTQLKNATAMKSSCNLETTASLLQAADRVHAADVTGNQRALLRLPTAPQICTHDPSVGIGHQVGCLLTATYCIDLHENAVLQ